VTPEAFLGGPIALVQEGDTIKIDIPRGMIDLEVPPDQLERRKKEWNLPERVHLQKGGLLSDIGRSVGSAMKGCILE